MRAWPVGLLLAALLTACGPTIQARRVKPSGFLGDYSHMRKGKEGEALRVYTKPGLSLKGYDKLIIDPITLWADRTKSQRSLSSSDRHAVVNYFHVVLHKKLSKDYKIVQQAGPGVLRLRVAITDAKASNVTLDTISTVVPQMLLVSSVKELVTGTPSFVGSVAVEAELLDSATGERLAAAVDKRTGQKELMGVTSKWDDVDEACDYWAEKMRARLAEFRRL
jgi:hypothetical protein